MLGIIVVLSSSYPILPLFPHIFVSYLSSFIAAWIKDRYASGPVYYFKDALVQIAIKTFGHNESEGADAG